MDINVFRGIVTGLLLGLYVWLVFWAWSRGRAEDFDEAAQTPLQDEPLDEEVKRS